MLIAKKGQGISPDLGAWPVEPRFIVILSVILFSRIFSYRRGRFSHFLYNNNNTSVQFSFNGSRLKCHRGSANSLSSPAPASPWSLNAREFQVRTVPKYFEQKFDTKTFSASPSRKAGGGGRGWGGFRRKNN